MQPRRLTTAVARSILPLMKPVKAMTIRLSADEAEALDTIATVDDQPVSAVIRAAIADHIQSRRKDKDFQDSLKKRIDRAQRFLRP